MKTLGTTGGFDCDRLALKSAAFVVDIVHMDDLNQTSEPPVPTRRALHSDAFFAIQEHKPLVARGTAGGGVEQLARKIARANKYAPTPGRASAAEAYARGAAGEQAVAQHLQWLDGHGYWVLHDQPWPDRSKANIDHIVIGTSGVFVVDAKNWSGKLEIGPNGLTQNGLNRNTAITSMREQARAVRRLIRSLKIEGADSINVIPVLAFLSEDAPFVSRDGVTVLPLSALAQHIGTQPANIVENQVGELSYRLEEALEQNRKYTFHMYTERKAAALVAANKRPLSENRGQGPRTQTPAQTRPAQNPARSKHNQRSENSARKRMKSFLQLLVALGILAVLVYQPSVVTDAATKFGEVVSTMITDIVAK